MERKTKIKVTTFAAIILLAIGAYLWYRASVTCCGSYYLGEDTEAELFFLSIFVLFIDAIVLVADIAFVVSYFQEKRKNRITEL